MGGRYGDRMTRQNSKCRRRIYAAVVLPFCLHVAAFAQGGTGDEFERLLKQGFALHQQARFVEAIPLLERARRLEPDDYFANLLLGIDLLRTGKTAEAVPRLELAARVRPGEEIPEEYLGEAQASLGHYALAAEAYRRTVERQHGSEQALEAWTDFSLERFRQLGAELRATDAGVAAVRRLQAAAAQPAATMVCEGSIPALEQKLAQSQDRRQAHEGVEAAYRLSVCYAVEADKAAKELKGRAQDMPALHRLRGDVLLRLKGDPAAAEQEYRQAIALRPGDPALLERLAEAEFSAGDMEGARQAAQATLAVDPHRSEALRTLASLAMTERDYAQALVWLRQLAAESPADRTVQVELAKALAQTGNAAEALKHLEPALAAGYPDEKGALHALEARVLRDLGRDNEAAQAAAEARRLSDAFQASGKEGARERQNGHE